MSILKVVLGRRYSSCGNPKNISFTTKDCVGEIQILRRSLSVARYKSLKTQQKSLRCIQLYYSKFITLLLLLLYYLNFIKLSLHYYHISYIFWHILHLYIHSLLKCVQPQQRGITQGLLLYWIIACIPFCIQYPVLWNYILLNRFWNMQRE